MPIKKTRADRIIGLGLMIVPYWIFFFLFLCSDFYLTLPVPALILKVLLVPVLVANLAGLFFGLRLSKTSRSKKTIAIFIHLLPLLAAGGFFAWLFFGLKL